MRESLIGRFARAGLTLVLSDRPIVGGLTGQGASSIVQIDIQRKTNGSRRFEWFRIFPGAEENRIEVVGIDKKFGQVVLMVQEPEREFTENVPWRSYMDTDRSIEGWQETLAKKLGVPRSDLIVFPKGSVRIRRRTPSQKRHFLCGLDERQLFIAQLAKGCSTVREAHASLKTADVTLAENRGINAVRQGEWFLLEATQTELRHIEDGISRNLIVIENNVPIGPFTDATVRLGGRKRVRQARGNPHTADELIVLPGAPLREHGWAVRTREVFVRGRVRHVDHATVKFSQWRKVIRNTEANTGQALGVGWVD